MKRIILNLWIVSATLFALSNEEIAKKSYEITKGFGSSSSNMKMILINANGQKTTRQMSSKILEGVDGDKVLMEFLTPADVKGTRMLTHEHIDRDDDQWMYLPALKRVKRIAGQNKSGSFMGSEFSYEDTSNVNWKKYNYNKDVEEVDLDGVKCYKSSRTPHDKNSGYTKQVVWVAKDNFLLKRVDYYDRKRELLKTAIFSEWKNIDGIYLTGKIEMKNYQNSKQTILQWSNQKIKLNLSEKDFSKRKLKR